MYKFCHLLLSVATSTICRKTQSHSITTLLILELNAMRPEAHSYGISADLPKSNGTNGWTGNQSCNRSHSYKLWMMYIVHFLSLSLSPTLWILSKKPRTHWHSDNHRNGSLDGQHSALAIVFYRQLPIYSPFSPFILFVFIGCTDITVCLLFHFRGYNWKLFTRALFPKRMKKKKLCTTEAWSAHVIC